MTSERIEEVTYTLQSFCRISALFNMSKPGHVSRIHKNIYKNSETCLSVVLKVATTIFYSRRARWPPLSALLRVQKATPCLLHTQIRARGPHQPRNVAESGPHTVAFVYA